MPWAPLLSLLTVGKLEQSWEHTSIKTLLQSQSAWVSYHPMSGNCRILPEPKESMPVTQRKENSASGH